MRPVLAVALTAAAMITAALRAHPPPQERHRRAPDARPRRRADPGTRYRFADVLPGLLDVELTAPVPALYSHSQPDVAVLNTTRDFQVDAVWFADVTDLRVAFDPYFSPEAITSDDGYLKVSAPLPLTCLAHFARLPFVDSEPRRSRSIRRLGPASPSGSAGAPSCTSGSTTPTRWPG